jgi:hypothetical protein
MTPIVIILSLECLIKNCKISGRVIPPVFVHSYRNVYNIRIKHYWNGIYFLSVFNTDVQVIMSKQAFKQRFTYMIYQVGLVILRKC